MCHSIISLNYLSTRALNCPSIRLSIRLNQLQLEQQQPQPQQLFNQLATGCHLRRSPHCLMLSLSRGVAVQLETGRSWSRSRSWRRRVSWTRRCLAGNTLSSSARLTWLGWAGHDERKQLCWANGANRMRQIQLRLVLPATRLWHARDTAVTRSNTHTHTQS